MAKEVLRNDLKVFCNGRPIISVVNQQSRDRRNGKLNG